MKTKPSVTVLPSHKDVQNPFSMMRLAVKKKKTAKPANKTPSPLPANLDALDPISKMNLAATLMIQAINTIGASGYSVALENKNGNITTFIAGVVDPKRAKELAQVYRELDAKWEKRDEEESTQKKLKKVLRKQVAITHALEEAEKTES